MVLMYFSDVDIITKIPLLEFHFEHTLKHIINKSLLGLQHILQHSCQHDFPRVSGLVFSFLTEAVYIVHYPGLCGSISSTCTIRGKVNLLGKEQWMEMDMLATCSLQ